MLGRIGRLYLHAFGFPCKNEPCLMKSDSGVWMTTHR
jgi:hypothetical protein